MDANLERICENFFANFTSMMIFPPLSAAVIAFGKKKDDFLPSSFFFFLLFWSSQSEKFLFKNYIFIEKCGTNRESIFITLRVTYWKLRLFIRQRGKEEKERRKIHLRVSFSSSSLWRKTYFALWSISIFIVSFALHRQRQYGAIRAATNVLRLFRPISKPQIAAMPGMEQEHQC